MTISLFWIGWTSYPSVSLWAPLIGGLPMGASITLIFVSWELIFYVVCLQKLENLTCCWGFILQLSLLNYLVDVYLQVAATALAANTVVRSSFGAGFPVSLLCMIVVSVPLADLTRFLDPSAHLPLRLVILYTSSSSRTAVRRINVRKTESTLGDHGTWMYRARLHPRTGTVHQVWPIPEVKVEIFSEAVVSLLSSLNAEAKRRAFPGRTHPEGFDANGRIPNIIRSTLSSHYSMTTLSYTQLVFRFLVSSIRFNQLPLRLEPSSISDCVYSS